MNKQPIYILYFTQSGARLAEIVRSKLEPKTSVTGSFGKGCLQAWTQEHFRKGNVLVYIGACGIAVRAIAPFLKGKDTDPAVIVMDEKGQNVIPILSGHLGGANAWAQKLSQITGGQAVLTTATDVNGLFSVDVFAAVNDLSIDDLGKAASFSAQLLREKAARLIIPDRYADMISLAGEAPSELKVQYASETEPSGAADAGTVLLSPDQTAEGAPLQLIPRCIIVGMGCRRGKSYEQLKAFAVETLEELGLRRESVAALASIDVKKEEPGLVTLAADLGVPLLTFSAEQLEETKLSGWTFTESDRVREHVGTGNVCERAAAAAGAERILTGKTSKDGMTICVGMAPVQLYWKAENKAAENESKDNAAKENTLKENTLKENSPKGHLFVVGIGPGMFEGMTGQAAAALEHSDTIIGYSVYNDLVKPYYPDKRYLTTPMTGEEARCRMALEEARAGHTVSLICSGDPGVYGMAGLVLELAGKPDADKSAADKSGRGRSGPDKTDEEIKSDIEIEIISGVTAALSGAALLGAPLVHDFAVISLSDRLTPWELIERRLRAAAQADLCIVLYNPSSRGRKEHLHRAAQILMEDLPGSRVCGIADRIGREGEKTRVMTLGELAEAETDMFSTVFIGNSSTRQLGNKMVTPRGYDTEKR